MVAHRAVAYWRLKHCGIVSGCHAVLNIILVNLVDANKRIHPRADACLLNWSESNISGRVAAVIDRSACGDLDIFVRGQAVNLNFFIPSLGCQP